MCVVDLGILLLKGVQGVDALNGLVRFAYCGELLIGIIVVVVAVVVVTTCLLLGAAAEIVQGLAW